jgi:adenosylhomocysteine nucleosidase
VPVNPSSAVIISANTEWREVKKHFPNADYQKSPFGEYFFDDALFVHCGVGKISAAACTQYLIDRWNPSVLINLGTCGGIAGCIERFATVLATRTVVYDIIEQISNVQEAIEFYSTDIDLSWLGERLPSEVIRMPLYSADRDIVPAEIEVLVKNYEAAALDWESGAIAWVAKRNGKRVLILRGVSDLVGPQGGEAYGNTEVFREGAAKVMKSLLQALPRWLELVSR